MRNRVAILLSLLAVLVVQTTASGQAQDMIIDAAGRVRVIDELSKSLTRSYVNSDTAKLMVENLARRERDRDYDGVSSSRDLATKLTEHLQAVSRDKHLRVSYSFEKIPLAAKGASPPVDDKVADLFFQNRLNSGFERVERLEGNIGYIELRGFLNAELGAQTVSYAMSFIANTDALIFDLRQSGGGDPAMVALICSYFFGDKPVHLNSIYYRETDQKLHYWTNPNVSGKKFLDKPIYVLTQSQTFSAAEEFAYDLQNLKRATIIGEKTRGGAHPGDSVRLTDHFSVNMPMGRAINPITRTNWEGTGVTPDILVPKEQALKTAYILALNKAAEKIPHEYIRSAMKEIAERTQKELDEMRRGGQQK
jgi:C-terminal processing protease CtpA/Prc